MARRLAREEGLFAGTSSGANIVASLCVAQRLGTDATVVTILCDSGLAYCPPTCTARLDSGSPQAIAAADGHPLCLARNLVHVASATFVFSHPSNLSVIQPCQSTTEDLSAGGSSGRIRPTSSLFGGFH